MSDTKPEPIWKRKAKAVFRLLRPFTLLAPFITCIAFAILGIKAHGDIANIWSYTLPVLAGAISLSLLNAASNAQNQVFDMKEDSLGPKRTRPVVSGELSEAEAMALAVLGVSLSLFFAAFVSFTFMMLAFSIFLFTFIYSVPPMRTKRFFLVNMLTISIPRGFIGPLAAFATVGSPFEPQFYGICIVMFLFVTGGNVSKDYPDTNADKLSGIRSMTVVLGFRGAGIFAAAFISASFAALIGLVWFGVLRFSTLYILAIIPVGIWMLVCMLWKPQTRFRSDSHASWFGFYLTMLLFVIGFLTTAFV